jgi:hypothetical protein
MASADESGMDGGTGPPVMQKGAWWLNAGQGKPRRLNFLKSCPPAFQLGNDETDRKSTWDRMDPQEQRECQKTHAFIKGRPNDRSLLRSAPPSREKVGHITTVAEGQTQMEDIKAARSRGRPVNSLGSVAKPPKTDRIAASNFEKDSEDVMMAAHRVCVRGNPEESHTSSTFSTDCLAVSIGTGHPPIALGRTIKSNKTRARQVSFFSSF